MADYLRVVAPHILSPLVSRKAFSNIQALAQSLPPLSVAGFECRLGQAQSRVDFFVCSPCIVLNLPKVVFTHPTWQTFRQFCQDWTDLETDLRRIVEYIWLEFDLIGKPLQVPIPCISFTLKQKTVGDCRLREIAIKSLIKLLQPCDSLLLESNIRTCVDSLPNGARIAHMGVMLSRPAKAVRLVVKGISPQQLPDYLRQIGWKDPTNTLPTLIPNLCNFVDSIALAFDVGESIYPRIGLECFLNKQSFIDKLGWQSFLDDYLVKEDLCTPGKRNALLAWPGLSQKADQPELWPNSLNQLDSLFGAKALSVFCRTFSHLKIVHLPGSPLSAKAYLFLEHLYLERDALMSKSLQPENST